jgi:hypothetical protein
MSPTCGSTCGITQQRARDKARARALAQRVFSEGIAFGAQWLPEKAPFARGETDTMAAALAEVLPCTLVVAPWESAHATWVHLVAAVDGTSWLGWREGLTERPPRPEETSLRVGFSHFGRYATLQEVRLRGTPEHDGCSVEEQRLIGVEDRRLQSFVKATQGLLRSRRVVCLDAAFLAEPLHDHSNDSLWQCLFDPEPMALSYCTWVPQPQ